MKAANKVQVAIYQQAKQGNFYCGDSYYYIETETEFVCALADGLGSGELAWESSQVVIDIMKHHIDATVSQLMKLCNKQLIGKRGVVLGILKLNYQTQSYSFASIGNIGVIAITKDGKKKRNIPTGGYLASYNRPVKMERHPLEPEMNFFLFSDGVTSKELSQTILLNNNVEDITKIFTHLNGSLRSDDTTLIAISYKR